MALIDSILAFALTLAALATVVTIFLEIYTRVRGLKARRQVELFSKLFDEVLEKQLPDTAEKWDVIKAILESRFSGQKMAETEDRQRYVGMAAGAVYEDVSLEHVLRRLVEVDKVAEALAESKTFLEDAEKKVKAKLGLIARKYEEYCSALGADFKRHAMRRSIWVGIILAFAMNVDGVRLLTSYLQNPELREKVIEKLEIPEEPAQQETSDGTGQTVAAGKTDSVEDALKRVQAAKDQLALIDELNLPIGTSFFPQCYWFFEKEARSKFTDPLCQRFADKAALRDWSAEDKWLAIIWFLKVLLTGLLIGLGAPFWYDVAKRLAAVRQAFKGKGSAETSNRGADAAGKPDERRTLIDQIVGEIREAVEAGVDMTLPKADAGSKTNGGNGGAAPAPGETPA